MAITEKGFYPDARKSELYDKIELLMVLGTSTKTGANFVRAE